MLHRILLVDDDRDIRETLSDVLRDDGFEVCAVANGQEAIDNLKGGAEPPAAVLLDLRMPVMDGRTFLSIRRRDSGMAAIPVIVLTAEDGNCADVVQSFDVKCCIHKPFRMEQLMHAIRACT